MVGVALSRVRSVQHLQVLGFSPYCCMSPPKAAVEFAESRSVIASGPPENCCRVKHSDQDREADVIEVEFEAVSIQMFSPFYNFTGLVSLGMFQ